MFLRFSLSRALNSVTRRPADPISCIRGKAVIGASDPHHVVTRQYATRPDRVVSFDLVHVETGTDRVLMPEGDESAVVYVGRKWLVHCTGSGSLTLHNLTARHAEVRLGNCLPENAYSCAGIVQGVRGDSDHVMFVFNGSGGMLILVQVDLCETYRTQELGVMHMTAWKIQFGVRFSSAVVMRRLTGDRVVYVEIGGPFESSGTVFELCEGGGCAPPSAELWDCNNTAAPLRVVPGRPSIAGVTAESGFLFHRGFDRKIDVTDPHGALVGTIHFPHSILFLSVTGFT
ncbi:hypothetical protein Pelo_8314 [Pelomyxa schiedti]|nr:hypothetical protein Pelo_8314 [Pelomyxa schiedti]